MLEEDAMEWDILYSMFVLFGFSILVILIIVGAIRFVAEKELRKEIRKGNTLPLHKEKRII